MSHMTRKHFKALAAMMAHQMAATREPDIYATVGERNAVRGAITAIAAELANVCAAENPRFDRERFMRACGVSQ